jgi:hypothetical protein
MKKGAITGAIIGALAHQLRTYLRAYLQAAGGLIGVITKNPKTLRFFVCYI